MIDLDKISLHSSDGSDIISSTEKKISEKQNQIGGNLSQGSLTLSKLSQRHNTADDDYFYQVKNEYKQHSKQITVERADGSVSALISNMLGMGG